MQKTIALTQNAAKRLDEKKAELLKCYSEMVNDLLLENSVPGDDEIEVTASDVDAATRQVRLLRLDTRPGTWSRRMAFIYMIGGLFMVAGSWSYQYWAADTFSPVRMFWLAGMGMLTVGMLLWFYVDRFIVGRDDSTPIRPATDALSSWHTYEVVSTDKRGPGEQSVQRQLSDIRRLREEIDELRKRMDSGEREG